MTERGEYTCAMRTREPARSCVLCSYDGTFGEPLTTQKRAFGRMSWVESRQRGWCSWEALTRSMLRRHDRARGVRARSANQRASAIVCSVLLRWDLRRALDNSGEGVRRDISVDAQWTLSGRLVDAQWTLSGRSVDATVDSMKTYKSDIFMKKEFMRRKLLLSKN